MLCIQVVFYYAFPHIVANSYCINFKVFLCMWLHYICDCQCKSPHVGIQSLPFFQSLKSHNSVTMYAYCNVTKVCSLMAK